MKKYIILDEQPKEGDYGINPNDPKKKPRLVERYSKDMIPCKRW